MWRSHVRVHGQSSMRYLDTDLDTYTEEPLQHKDNTLRVLVLAMYLQCN
jgi:hypothetical protein